MPEQHDPDRFRINYGLRNLRYGVALALTGLLSWTVIRFMGLWPIGVDDANILFVYSKHLAAGEGLVYNIGSERVEGFSSMLWMLLSSLGYLFMEQPYPLFLFVNILLVGTALGFALRFVEFRAHGTGDDALPITLGGLLFLTWTVANPAYFLWTVTSLMETGLWSALLVVTGILCLRTIETGDISPRRTWRIATMLGCIILTRPEGMAWALYFATLFLIILRWSGLSWRKSLSRLAPVVVVPGVTAALLVLFRLLYFGFPFPNTYYVKMGADRWYTIQLGLDYLEQFLADSGITLLFVIAAVVGVLRSALPVTLVLFAGQRRIERDTLGLFAIGTMILVGLLLPVLMGGDHFGGYRFFQPVWPLFIVILYYLPMPWQRIQRLHPLLVSGIGLVLLTIFTLGHSVRWPNLEEDRGRLVHQFELSHRGIVTGEHLEALFGAEPTGLPSIGVSAAGGRKIGYSGTVIDMMGLNFTPMAHHSGDKQGIRGHAAFSRAVFWDYAPDLLEPDLCPAQGLPANRFKQPDNWMYRIYRGLYADPEFLERYRYVVLADSAGERRVCTWADRKLLRALQDSDTVRITPVD